MESNYITNLRKNLGLNQMQFAQLFGVHHMTASRWERADLVPTPYQQAMMREFEKASKDKSIRDTLTGVIIGAGVMAAVLMLLQRAKG